MLKRVTFLGVFVAGAGFLALVARCSTSCYALTLPLLALFIGFAELFQEKTLSRSLAGLSLIFGFAWILIRSHDTYFLSAWSAFAAVYIGFFIVTHRWQRCVLSVESEHVAIEKEVSQVARQVEEKATELKRLETHVNEIIELFESAKHLNECLSYEEVVKTLTEKVLKPFQFTACELLIAEETEEGKKNYLLFELSQVRFGKKPIRQTAVSADEEAEALVQLATRTKQPIKVQSARETEAQKLTVTAYPCWVFPLFVEEILVGVLTIEGPQESDFQKFSIIAMQLALQVKKIKLYEEVKQLSITDGLTRAFVRRYFLERFAEELKRSIKHQYKLVVLMIDIDHFKQYNDSYGHLVGDVTLKEVAQQIRDSIRKVDILARYGGEEFAIVLPETNLAGGLEAAERIRSKIARQKFRVYDEQTQVTVSVGVAVFPDDLKLSGKIQFRDDFALELLKCADQALYRAKEEGRNRVIH